MKAALLQIPTKVQELIERHKEDLIQTWADKDPDETLTISFSVKVSVDKKGKNVCDVTIQFIKERIKTVLQFEWDDRQLPLLKEAVRLDSDLRKKGMAMTIKDRKGEPLVTLGAAEALKLDPPCLTCSNDQERHGGKCGRELFHATPDGKAWECEGYIDQKDLPEDTNKFYTNPPDIKPQDEPKPHKPRKREATA